MSAILAMARNDVRLLLRDKAGFFFTFFFPLLFAVFFGVITSGFGGGDGALGIVVVDEDATQGSADFVGRLERAPEVEVTPATRAEAEEMVRKGRRAAYVAIRPGFGNSIRRVFWGESGVLEVGIDPSRKAEAGMLQGVLMRYAWERVSSVFTDREAMRDSQEEAKRAAADDPVMSGLLTAFFGSLNTFLDATPKGEGGFQGFEPVRVETREVALRRSGPKNAFDVSFPQGIVWGIMGCAAVFGIALVVERTRGTLLRLRVAPLTMRAILAGKALGCFLTVVCLQALLLAVAILLFGVRPASAPLLALAILCSAACFVGIMMLLSVLGRTEASASGIAWGILVLLAMVGGGMIPLFAMPPWLQTVSHLSPAKWVVLSLEGAIWRGFTLGDMLLPCAVLLGSGAAAFAAGVALFRRLCAD